MGTRSITTILNEEGEILLKLYRQFDGYFEGHGKELADFLKRLKLCNGISRETSETHANGMQCLAAQIVAHFKTCIGSIYITPASAEEEEFNYVIYTGSDYAEEGIKMKAGGYNNNFDGAPSEFDVFLDTLAEED